MSTRSKIKRPHRPRMYVEVHDEAMARQNRLVRAAAQVAGVEGHREGGLEILRRIKANLNNVQGNLRDQYGRANQLMDTSAVLFLGGRLNAIQSLRDLLNAEFTGLTERTDERLKQSCAEENSAREALDAIATEHSSPKTDPAVNGSA